MTMNSGAKNYLSLLAAAALAVVVVRGNPLNDLPADRKCTAAVCGFDGAAYENGKTLADEPSEGVAVYAYWTLDDDAEEVTICLDAHGTAGGWFGFGLSANGGMMGADIAVLRKVDNAFVLEDTFTDDWATPWVDEHQDLELLSAVRDTSGGRTSFCFRRKYAPCDGGAATEAREWKSKEDLDIFPFATSSVIWAQGTSDNFYQHMKGIAYRGKAEITWKTTGAGQGFGDLASQEANQTAGSQGAENGTIVVEMVNLPYDGVPEDGTKTVHAYYNIPPSKNGDWILTGFNRVLGKGVEPYIHHTLLYGCSEEVSENRNPGPRTEGVCSEILFVLDDLSSEKIGNRIGNGTNIRSFRVEVHYDRPIGNVKYQKVDPGTGYYLTLAPNDGTYTEMGSMTTGNLALLIPSNSPAGSKESTFWGECVVGNGAGPDGIELLYFAWHQHLVGRQMWAMVERKGKPGVLEEVGRQMFYDWNFQGPGGFPKPIGVKVYPGDKIYSFCSFDTTNRWNFGVHGGKTLSKDEWTTFGEGTYEEMCFNFIMYKPRKEGFNICVGNVGGGVSSSSRLLSEAKRTPPSATVSLPYTAKGNPRRASEMSSIASAAMENIEKSFQKMNRELIGSAASIAAPELSTRRLDESTWSVMNKSGDCTPELEGLCKQASICYGVGCVNETFHSSLSSLCAPAAACWPCYMNSPCAKPDPASIIIPGPKCPKRMQNLCKVGASCFGSLCNPNSNPDTNPSFPFLASQCTQASACHGCFPKSPCSKLLDVDFSEMKHASNVRSCECADDRIASLDIDVADTGLLIGKVSGNSQRPGCTTAPTTSPSTKPPSVKGGVNGASSPHLHPLFTMVTLFVCAVIGTMS